MAYRYVTALVGAALSCSLAFTVASAAPVYKVEGKDGRISYSSKPPSKDAKPANLPEIMRGEVKLVEHKMVNCDRHGGVNCQAGPDSDGSVICTDGFKGASPRFRFTCNSPKLEISDISEVDGLGAFTVFVRNTKSVAAKKPAVVFKGNSGKEITILGPDVIDPFGVAEFQFQPTDKLQIDERPTLANLNLTCANCPQ